MQFHMLDSPKQEDGYQAVLFSFLFFLDTPHQFHAGIRGGQHQPEFISQHLQQVIQSDSPIRNFFVQTIRLLKHPSDVLQGQQFLFYKLPSDD